jgi:HPt (histidine-containing phosphotransfer) domain-containing protein
MVRSTAAELKRAPGAANRGRYPIDRVHLAKQTLGDPGLELEVLRMFDETARVYFGRLERSTSVEELLRHLHTLKGAAAGIGAVTIAKLAATSGAEHRSIQNGSTISRWRSSSAAPGSRRD